MVCSQSSKWVFLSVQLSLYQEDSSHCTQILAPMIEKAHGMQSKQQIGFPFCTAFLVPGGQLSLHTDFGI
ncbi:hypothetical protein QTP86_025026 [Hemibagrus guttatus]|nr:hypothetical protein QTP86_025026 [Hemibagrus guttatus]